MAPAAALLSSPSARPPETPRTLSAAGLRRRYVCGKLAEDAALALLRGNPPAGVAAGAHGLLAAVHRRALAALRRLPSGPRGADTADVGLRLGVPHTRTFVVASRPAWADLAALESTRIRQCLGAGATDVQHVGSTAVPGLAAKPILDFGVALAGPAEAAEVAAAAERLRRLGYRYLGNRRGLGGHFLEKGPFPLRTHALQLHGHASPDLPRLLRFRDLLRGNPLLAAEYALIKYGLAAGAGDDRRLYLWYKAHWVNGLLLDRSDARAWSDWLRAQDPPSFYRMHLRRRRPVAAPSP